MMTEKCVEFLASYEKKINDATKLEKQIFGNETSRNDYYENMERGLQLEIRYGGKDNEPIAFIAVYNRTYNIETEEGRKTKISRHLWLCGVLPEYRNVGLMKSLFWQCFSGDINFTTTICGDKRGYDSPIIISIHTYPDYYKDMFELVKKYEFNEECELKGKYEDRGRFVRYTIEIEKFRNRLKA